jgi:hypothetical protein
MMNMAIPSNYNTRPVQQSPTNHTPPKTPQGTNSQNIKNAATPKKDTKNTWLLWGSALAGTVLVGAGIFLGVKSYRHAEAVKQIPKNLERVFGKSYSKEESLQVVKTYQDLLKIEDQNTFIEKAFHQIKKDFGYEDLKLKLHIVDKPIGETKDSLLQTFGNVDRDEISIYGERERKYILNTIAHEFQHLRQFEYMIRAELMEDSLYELGFNQMKNRSKENPQDVKEMRESAQDLRRFYENLFKPLKPPKIEANTSDYQKAFAYAESVKEDVNISEEAYNNNWLEQEAKQIGVTMQELIGTIQKMKP